MERAQLDDRSGAAAKMRAQDLTGSSQTSIKHEISPSIATSQKPLSENAKRILEIEHHATKQTDKRPRLGEATITAQATAEDQYQSKRLPDSSKAQEPSPHQAQAAAHYTPTTIAEARIDFWREGATWPTEEQVATMHRLREIVDQARPRPRSPSRKRSNASMYSESDPTQTSSSQIPREQKSAPYSHPLFEHQLQECGSFMNSHLEGITAESQSVCQALMERECDLPTDTLFSDDDLFRKTCSRLRVDNEAKVIRDIAPLIVPSAEILADRGAKHLEVVRETLNVRWVNSALFITGPGLRPGPRPQPDFGLGFKREAFGRERISKLRPYLGDLLSDATLFAATYNMYLPFFSAEVKRGAAALDIADRQNAHTQSVNLRGLYALFRLVGREAELHREINGFSVSHNDAEVRIWGHYIVLDGGDAKYYRHLIKSFSLQVSNGKERWTAYAFVRALYDLWVPKHFQRICDVIDQIPADLNFNVSDADSQPPASSSASNEILEDYDLEEGRSAGTITPDTTTGTQSNKSGPKRKVN